MIDVDRINALMAPVRELANGNASEPEAKEKFVLHIRINGEHLFYQKLLIDEKWTRSQAFAEDIGNARIFSSHENARHFASENPSARRFAASVMPLAEANDLARGILAEYIIALCGEGDPTVVTHYVSEKINDKVGPFFTKLKKEARTFRSKAAAEEHRQDRWPGKRPRFQIHKVIAGKRLGG